MSPEQPQPVASYTDTMKLADIERWLARHASDLNSGRMLLNFMQGDCEHDYLADHDGACELCGVVP